MSIKIENSALSCDCSREHCEHFTKGCEIAASTLKDSIETYFMFGNVCPKAGLVVLARVLGLYMQNFDKGERGVLEKHFMLLLESELGRG